MAPANLRKLLVHDNSLRLAKFQTCLLSPLLGLPVNVIVVLLLFPCSLFDGGVVGLLLLLHTSKAYLSEQFLLIALGPA